MNSWNLPSAPQALVFDLDSTLYTHEGYARFQTRVLVERLAAERNESFGETEALVAATRAVLRAREGGDSSLGRIFLELGIPIQTSISWREDLIRPAAWLVADPKLDACLARLRDRFRLALVTNNPRSVGEASLEVLGVRRHFEFALGLDDSLRSKPDPASFALALSRLNLPAETCVSVGDRQDIDIAPALALGMGALLVRGVEEVYGLPLFFAMPA